MWDSGPPEMFNHNMASFGLGDVKSMTTLYLVLGTYAVVATFGVFVVTPWLVAYEKLAPWNTDFGVLGSILWPIFLPGAVVFQITKMTLFYPAAKLYGFSEAYFQAKAAKATKPKKPEPPLDPVNEVKSTYRNIELAAQVGKVTLKHKWENFLKDREEKKKAKEKEKTK